MAFKATVITSDGQRVLLRIECSARTDAELIIDRSYPEARYVGLIALRKEQRNA